MPAELAAEMEKAKQKLTVDMVSSEILGKRGDSDRYTRAANDALTEHEGYDLESFEMVEYIIEDYGPKLVAAADAMDAYLADLQKGADAKELAAKKEAFIEAARTMEVSNVTNSPAMKQLRENVTGFSTKEEEAELDARLANLVASSQGEITP